jgi:hypothetical protein
MTDTDAPAATTTPGTPAADLGAKIAALGATIDELRAAATLPEPRRSIARLDARDADLTTRISHLRGLAVEVTPDLESRLALVTLGWRDARPALAAAIDEQATDLTLKVGHLETSRAEVIAMSQSVEAAAPSLALAITNADALKQEIASVSSGLLSQAGPTSGGYGDLDSEIGRLEAAITAFSQAGVALVAGEYAIAAVDATAAGSARGQLYLSSLRLMFEAPQENAPRSVLLETPLGAITGVRATKEGLFGHEDHLYIRVPTAADEVHFHLYDQDSRAWQSRVESAIRGASSAPGAPAPAAPSGPG